MKLCSGNIRNFVQALRLQNSQSQQCCLSAESQKQSINLRKYTSACVEAESVKDESRRGRNQLGKLCAVLLESRALLAITRIHQQALRKT